MNTTYMVIAVIVVLVIVGVVLAPILARKKHSENLKDKFGSEYDRLVESTGDAKKARAELDERQKHADNLVLHPLSSGESNRYQTDWDAVQSSFIDEPGQAVVKADRLIIEIMQVRGYPLSDFDHRAADISVIYPGLVSDYRTAQEIAIKNGQQQANTEELRQAMIHYRSLFSALLEHDAAVKEVVE
jgi:hypothetical protein